MLISVLELSSEPTLCACEDFVSSISTVDADDSSVDERSGSVREEGEGVGEEVVVCWVALGASFCCGGEACCSGVGRVRVKFWSADVEGGSAAARLGILEAVVFVGVGIGSAIGSSCLVSLMLCTIFSKSTGVMCFSRPLLVLLKESCLRNSGRAFGIVVELKVEDVAGVDDVSSSSRSSDPADSRLVDSSGTGMSVVAACGLTANEHRGESVERACVCGAQQNVSRFHSRQLRFSNRFPSSIACEAFEKSDHCFGTALATKCFY